MNERMITPGELIPGVFVIALASHKHGVRTMFGVDPDGVDNSMVGLPLYIRAINLPFVVASICDRAGIGPPFTLDIRGLELMELSKEFVLALVPTTNAPNETQTAKQAQDPLRPCR